MIRSIHHVQLAMPPGQEDAARRFYNYILEIPERPKPTDLEKNGGCWFESGSLRIHLGVEKHFQPARKAHPGFQTDDLEGLIEKLENLGHAVTIGNDVDGCPRIFVNDPFGNRIEFIGRGKSV